MVGDPDEMGLVASRQMMLNMDPPSTTGSSSS